MTGRLVSIRGLGHGAVRVAALSAVLGLGGCLGFGEDSTPSTGPSSLRTAVFGNPQRIEPARQDLEEKIDYACPKVDVMEGGATFRAGGTGAGDVTHQASLLNVARECQFTGKVLTMRVGIEGRMLIGERGRPGTYTVPVSIAVKHLDKVVTTRVSRVTVSIPAGQAARDFTHVEEGITVPITEMDPGDQYDVYVGFDGRGATDPKRGRRRR